MVSHDMANIVRQAEKILHLQQKALFGERLGLLKSAKQFLEVRRMSIISEMMSYPFIMRALIGGVLVSLCASCWCGVIPLIGWAVPCIAGAYVGSQRAVASAFNPVCGAGPSQNHGKDKVMPLRYQPAHWQSVL